MSIACTIQFTMLSDWHIGSGAATRGDLDSTLWRDRDRFPLLPASTVKGILRDAAEQAAYALDDGAASGAWQDVAAQLFGDEAALRGAGAKLGGRSPRPGLLTVGAAELSAYVKQALPNQQLRRALGFTKPGVAIDSASGTAKQDHLLLDEVGRKGAVLTASLAVAVDDSAVLAFLAACCRIVESVGGKRRRGLGRCDVKLFKDGAEIKFKMDDLNKVSAISGSQAAGPVKFGDSSSDVDFITSAFSVRTLTPLIAGGRVKANIVTSAPCLPGSVLLSEVIRLLESAYPAEKALIGQEIANGGIRVLPAYPMHGGKRLLPTPLGFQVAKEGGANGKELFDGYAPPVGGDVQRKDLRNGFVTKEAAKLNWLSHPAMSVQTHNAIDDVVQRPTADVVGVFVYEGLAAGQEFGGYLQIRKNLGKLTGFKFGKPVPARLGRARGRDYGNATISAANFVPTPAKAADKTSGDWLYLWFESDAVLLDARMQPVTSLHAVASELERLLNTPGAFCRKDSRSFLRSVLADGWIGAWGLPRPGMLCVAAGSTVALKCLLPITAEALKILQREGLGIRRSEGFGVISFDADAMRKPTVLQTLEAHFPPAGGPPQAKPNETEQAFVDTVIRAAWLEWIEKSAEWVASNKKESEIWKTGADARKIRAALELVGREVPAADIGEKKSLAAAFAVISGLHVWGSLDQANISKPAEVHPPGLLKEAREILVLTHIQLAHRASPAAKDGEN